MTRDLISWMVIFVFVAISGRPVKADTNLLSRTESSPYDVIAAVNELRAANGLPPYQANNALMSAAQAHSNYMAENQVISHTGAGGSSPKSRAVAAGYGNGATIFVSENIALGTNMSPQGAVNIWQGDSLHLSTMLSSSYQDVGAGVATNGDVFYYTLEAGNVAGSAPANPPSDSGASSPLIASPTVTIANAEFVHPVLVATPLADGSIVHVVEYGQVLTIIANAYNIPLDRLLEQNNLTADSLIFPGDQLVIQPAQVTLTSTLEPTPTRTPVVTVMPTTPVPTPSQTPHSPLPTPTNTPLATPTITFQKAMQADPLLLIIVAGIVVGITFVLVGSLFRQKK